MIDIHCHLLPGIDDGPQSPAEALILVNYAIKNGIEKAVVTPHIHPGRYENDLHSIKKSFTEFKELLSSLGAGLEIGMAAEVRICPEIIPMIMENKIPFLGHLNCYNIILLEFPHSHIPPGSDKLVKHLLNQGIKPMIAHPERNKEVMKDIRKIVPFIELGCMLQLTAGSLANKFGNACYEVAKELLIRNWVSVIASDAHNELHRPPDLKQGYLAAERLMGPDKAKELVYDMPLSIVNTQFI